MVGKFSNEPIQNGGLNLCVFKISKILITFVNLKNNVIIVGTSFYCGITYLGHILEFHLHPEIGVEGGNF